MGLIILPADEDKAINRKDWQRQHCKNCWSTEGLQDWGSGYSNTALPWCSQGCYRNPSQTQLGHIWKLYFAFLKDIICLLLGYIFPLSLGQINISMNIVLAFWQCWVLPKGISGSTVLWFPHWHWQCCRMGSHTVCTAFPCACQLQPSESCSWGLQGSDAQKAHAEMRGRTATNSLISSGLSLSYWI